MNRVHLPAQMAIGILLLASSWAIGLQTGAFTANVMLTLGFWLTFDAGDRWLTGWSLLWNRPRQLPLLILAGGLAGTLLDFQMVVVTGTLKYLAVTDILSTIQLFVGWGFCLPAIVSSYRFSCALWARRGTVGVKLISPQWRRTARPSLAYVGAALAVIPVFLLTHLRSGVQGWWIVPAFLGLWLLGEQCGRGWTESSLMGAWFEGRWERIPSLVLPAVLLILIWEGLNSFTNNWAYMKLFFLEPRIADIPLVAYFGYIAWYALFWTLYRCVAIDEEMATLP